LSFQLIIKHNISLKNSFWRRKSAEPTDLELQRRTSDVILTHDEKTKEKSLNSIEKYKTKVIFSAKFENHNAQHEMDHVTLDVPYTTCVTLMQ